MFDTPSEAICMLAEISRVAAACCSTAEVTPEIASRTEVDVPHRFGPA